MSKRKISFLKENVPKILNFLAEEKYEFHAFNDYHYRIMGAVCIIDLYPSRMVYNIVNIEGIDQHPNFKKDMRQQVDIKELKNLLEKGHVL